MNQDQYDALIEKYTDLLEGASKGDWIARAHLKEAALSTSDFPFAFTDIKTAQLQAKYALEDEQQVWRKIARKVTVPNFLPQSFIDLGWDDSAFDNILATNGGYDTVPGTLPNVPEGTEYPTAFKLYSSAEQLEIRKAGMRIAFTFEAIINDQWNVVDDLPGWLLRTALNSEDAEVAKLLSDGDGPNSTYFNAGNNNLLEYGTNTDGQAALTRETLKVALKQANSHKAGPNNNRPVRFNRFALVVPPSLEDLANELKDVPTQFIVHDGNLEYPATFTYGVAFEVVVLDWLEAVDKTHGATAWYVVPFAGDGIRTSLGLGFLQNYDRPELRLHNDQGVYLGGGDVPARQGSFLNDTWQLRLRHIFGGVALNGGIGTVASSGQAAPVLA
jgi:hypothetical protein